MLEELKEEAYQEEMIRGLTDESEFRKGIIKLSRRTVPSFNGRIKSSKDNNGLQGKAMDMQIFHEERLSKVRFEVPGSPIPGQIQNRS